MARGIIVVILSLAILSCSRAPSDGEGSASACRQTMQARSDQFRSAAYLIDLRLTDRGRNQTVMLELYCAGDSIGFYGRGFFGKGAFKGAIIADTATVYFDSRKEYYSVPMQEVRATGDCTHPEEMILYLVSLLSGRDPFPPPEETVAPSRKVWHMPAGRFQRSIHLGGKGGAYPKRDVLVDPACGDSIIVENDFFSRTFPFYQPREGRYENRSGDFRVRGYIREQKYNIPLSLQKFSVIIPPDAVRLEALGR